MINRGGALLNTPRQLRMLCVLASLAWSNGVIAERFYLPGVTFYRGETVVTPFTLRDQHGEVVNLDTLHGHWNVLYFGYLSCPDACPTTMMVTKQVFAALWENEPEQTVSWQHLFVSLDPRRDKPDQIKEYIDHFDSRFIGVSGLPSSLARLAKSVDVEFVYESYPDGRVVHNLSQLSSTDNYYVSHTDALVVVGPDGKLVAHVHATKNPQVVLDLLTKIRNHFDAKDK